jgi:predicted  nucleic acid-binding Zn-ribbon protein|tara:strand:- start:1388 stop:2089 length:702 start_codon:yes stop_codon:yes gene_type:complete
MPEDNYRLFELQDLDIKKKSLINNIGNIEKKLSDSLGIKELNLNLELVIKKLNEQKKAQIKINQSIELNEHEINNLNTRLYSGQIRNNKEAEAIKFELEKKNETNQQISTASDKVNENINKIDQIKENLELKILSSEEKWIDIKNKLLLDQKKYKQHLKKINIERVILSKKVDKQLLNLYERFFALNGNFGIVKIDNDLSPCCKIKLPNAFVEKVKISLNPIICNCGKSLIME